MVVPAGLNQLFLETGQPVQPGQLLPPQPLGPAQLKERQALAQRYGREVFAPDYLTKKQA